MNTTELLRYFEMVIDESDNTFVSASDKRMFLRLGHNEFRTIAYEETPLDFISTVNYTLSSQKSIDLASVNPDGAFGASSRLLGKDAFNPMLKIHSVAMMSTDDVSYYYDLVVDNREITDYPYPILATPIALSLIHI